MFCERTGKHRHLSRRKAVQHLAGVKKRIKNYNGMVYHCKHCGNYHIGRNPKEKRWTHASFIQAKQAQSAETI